MNATLLPEPMPAATDDSEWVRLTGAANDAFAGQRLCEALSLYRDALAEAERLFRNVEIAGSSVPAATIYVISCQNLAETARRTGESDAAEAWLRQAFERLAAAAESPATAFSLRLDCMRDLKLAFLNLVEGRREDVAFHPEMERLIVRGRSVVACVMGVVERLATLPTGELKLLDSATGLPS
jgi:hypothetical protein